MVNEEEEEFEIDANSLKLVFVKYLETLQTACKTNDNDREELARIHVQLVADRNVFQMLEAKINTQINNLAQVDLAKNEAATIFAEQRRIRQE